MDELNKRINNLRDEFARAADRINLHKLSAELDALRSQMQAPDFWSKKDAQAIAKHEAELARRIDPWLKLQVQTSDLKELAGMDDSSITLEIASQLDAAEKTFDDLKKQLRFTGPFDDHEVILSIHAGAGGTDAQDWAQMLLRMYVRWAEGHNLKVRTIDQTAGEEAGIKSAQIEITGGDFLYGKLAGEHGVHRLVRISPFNSGGSRETSFAKVEILPVIEKPDEVQVDEKDLKIDVFRAGGHGGQSVNTTDSAVRITHTPTGITVAIQNERSQLQNRETAMMILRSRLAQLQLEQHAATIADVKGPNQSAEFGNQIRSYVLHPYKQVKDTRTGFESSDPQKILDGDLDPLINAWLENR